MSFQRIQERLRGGRPLVLDADTGASFRARNIELDLPGALGTLLRRSPNEVLRHYRAEVRSRVDILSALTTETTPRALAEVGMQHRAAMITGLAVELALEAAAESKKPVAVAGLLGSERVAPLAADRLHEELTEHAERLAAAGCELLITRGQGSRLGLIAATVAAASTELPTWAVVECLEQSECPSEGAIEPIVQALENAGATAVLFEVDSVDKGIMLLDGLCSCGIGPDRLVPGILLAGSKNSVRGYPDLEASPERWADRALCLDQHHARLIGGGAGTTEAHTAAMARVLTEVHPSLPTTRSDTQLDRRAPDV